MSSQHLLTGTGRNACDGNKGPADVRIVHWPQGMDEDGSAHVQRRDRNPEVGEWEFVNSLEAMRNPGIDLQGLAGTKPHGSVTLAPPARARNHVQETDAALVCSTASLPPSRQFHADRFHKEVLDLQMAKAFVMRARVPGSSVDPQTPYTLDRACSASPTSMP